MITILLLMITTTFIVPVALATLTMGYLDKDCRNIRYALSIHADKGLWQQGPFLLSIAIPVVGFLIFGFPIWMNYDISLTDEGYREFLRVSTLPLGLLATAIPFTAITSRFHSAQQTVKQIALTQSKNNVDIFHSHRKEFTSYFENTKPNNFLNVIDARYDLNPRLHSKLFLGAPENGSPIPAMDLINSLIDRIDYARQMLDEVLRDSAPQNTYHSYVQFVKTIYNIAIELGIREIKDELQSKGLNICGINKCGEFEITTSLGNTTTEAIAAYRYCKSYLLTILHFIGNPDTIDLLYLQDIDYIDTNSGYLVANPDGPLIERRLTSGDEMQWHTMPIP